ncbi:MAG: CocE/NonD family hydrolase [Erythrobacter sp.]|nr:CocE/NonD family hydrolase [Erythrobacter sp.]
MIALCLAVYFYLGSKDPIDTFLEDDPEIRADPDYPVRIADIDALADRVVVERDVWIATRDGTRLSANIFRPAAEGEYPVVMAFTAYDKNKGPDRYPKLLRNSLKPDFDLGRFTVSEWTSWEGPDPAFWVPNGYAVVYVDARGFASSEGDPSTLSTRDREDFYDAIEWAGTQSWSNGNVGLNGVSYLAISQWVAASGNPPHLKAIIPWEGQSDPFREVLYHGGIPEIAFTSFWIRKMRAGSNGAPLPHPTLFNFAHRRPSLMRWVQQRPATTSGIDLPAIEIPALIAATWSDQGLHTRGSFEGYKHIASDRKWIFTHGRAKWDVYYSDEALAYQKDFFDHFLKGEDNGFDDRPSVRLEVREDLRNYAVRYVDDWPVPGTDHRQLFLNALGSLGTSPPTESGSAEYNSTSGRAEFSYTFAEDTEITGNMKLKLWVSTDEGDDMDLFVGVQKLDREGREVTFFAKTGYTKGQVAMGWLRVSQRALDEERSTPWQPVLLHDELQPISPGKVVPVEIEILPSSTIFRAGETLRLVVQGKDLFEHPALAHGYPVNHGNHSIHTGGAYDSHLLVPVVPRPSDDQPTEPLAQAE